MEQAQENADTLDSTIVMSDKVLFSWPRSPMPFVRTIKLWQANLFAFKLSKIVDPSQFLTYGLLLKELLTNSEIIGVLNIVFISKAYGYKICS